jgi:hypothetical protein
VRLEREHIAGEPGRRLRKLSGMREPRQLRMHEWSDNAEWIEIGRNGAFERAESIAAFR